MHEFSIASEIVRNVLETADRNGGVKVLSFQLEIGELAMLNVEQVTFWIRELLKGSVGEEAGIKVKRVRGIVSCDDCRHRSKVPIKDDFFDVLTPLSCPQCGSFRVRIERGKECCLKRIQLLR